MTNTKIEPGQIWTTIDGAVVIEEVRSTGVRCITLNKYYRSFPHLTTVAPSELIEWVGVAIDQEQADG